ncbi:hypothetical protein NQ317_003404 [Molorchus minor]|uniref:Uncharacterized protein n=1 Tax=Molorchus minor TaxID=1323400 RepID=A0ABQ9IQ80_9CUCU|nr:hypothetical protein NQ317_003404 [Molorchus minor]
MQIRCTGGGPPVKDKKEPTDDLLYSIINEKTITGLPSKFGGDVDSDVEADENRNISNSNDIEIIYEFSGNSNSTLDLTSSAILTKIIEPQEPEKESSNKETMQKLEKI